MAGESKALRLEKRSREAILTRREIQEDQVLRRLSNDALGRLRRMREPAWTDPMLATLTDKPFSDDDWYFERKLDGERCLAFKTDDDLRMMSRNEKELNEEYPELVRALARQKGRLVVDGEIVAFKDGVSSFAQLQNRMHLKDPNEIKERRKAVPVFYYLFDILYYNGYDTTHLELKDRKELLLHAVEFLGPLRYSEHRRKEGEKFFKESCKEGLEGLVAKRIDSIYVGRRSEDWLKFKCLHEQEFVVGAYTDPQGSRTVLGALLLGYHEDHELRYAGKVGTGFSRETLRMLDAKLTKVRTDKNPFDDFSPSSEHIHWIKPELIAEIRFSRWTKDGRLRHPVYLGLRDDKNPKEVARERPKKR